MKRILCLEDSREEQIVLRATLHSFEVLFASSLAEGLRLLDEGEFSLLLVDISLPDGTGLDLVAQARAAARFCAVPILILSGSTSLAQKEAAFAFGADDYVTKPFDPAELRIRVEAKVRRSEQALLARDLYPVGDLLLDRSARVLLRGTERIDLTSIEYRLFDLLASRLDGPYGREELIRTAWGENVKVTERTVDTHVANLRKKIRGTRVTIQTVFGAGYRLHVESPALSRTKSG